VNEMHAYVDAIYSSDSLVVFDPGSVFKFFEKQESPKVVTNFKEKYGLSGVGAIPLVPGRDNDAFSSVIERFFQP
jgi:hypothetical protein